MNAKVMAKVQVKKRTSRCAFDRKRVTKASIVAALSTRLREAKQGEKTMSMKQAYVEKLKAKLDGWDAEIDKIKAKADEAEASAQLKYYKNIEALRVKQLAAERKLNELKGSGEDAWEELKAGVESAWNSLRDAVKSARAEFK